MQTDPAYMAIAEMHGYTLQQAQQAAIFQPADRMLPGLRPDAEIIGIPTHRSQIENGTVVAAITPDAIHLGRINHTATSTALRITFDNPAYQPVDLDWSQVSQVYGQLRIHSMKIQ